ncbi:MAG: TonB family protein [Longimicrobiales bacterium]
MLAFWMLYAVLISGLVVLAGSALERVSADRRRWIWAGTLGLAAVLPLAAPLVREWFLGPRGLDILFGPAVPVLGAALSDLAERSAWNGGLVRVSLDGVLTGLWVGGSVLLSLSVVSGFVRMRRRAGSWRRAEVDGVAVLVSEDVGPAVVGVGHWEIVVPEWVLALDDRARGLILAHEQEHRRRGDPTLLALALALPVLMPWNPALWWAFFRLREAVETDCDRRVLARPGEGVVPYARLLLDVGARTVGRMPLGAGFGERTSSLERRIRLMLEKAGGTSRKGVAVRVALAALLVVAACSLEVNINTNPDDEPAATPAVEIPAPPRATEEPQVPREQLETGARSEETELPPPPEETEARPLIEAPTFTPFTVAPSITNRQEVIAAMEAEYPPLLRNAGIGGTVRVYFFIDAEGVVQRSLIDNGSGHEALDQAALRVAEVYRFSPALNRDRRVPVWVSFPITFQIR